MATLNHEMKFIGRTNPIKRYNYISLVIFLEIVVFFSFLPEHKVLSGISALLSLGLIVWIYFKINPDLNLLIFEEIGILHKTGKSTKRYAYDDVISYEFIDQQRNQSCCRIRFKNLKIDHILDTDSGRNFRTEEFVDLLLSKNEAMEIIHKQTNFETYRFFKKEGQLRKVLINEKSHAQHR